MYAVPEMLAWDRLEFLCDGAVDGRLSSFFWCLQEHGKESKQQRHEGRMSHQFWLHCPRMHRIHSHIWP